MVKEKNAHWIVHISFFLVSEIWVYPLVEIMPEIPRVLKFAHHNVVSQMFAPISPCMVFHCRAVALLMSAKCS